MDWLTCAEKALSSLKPVFENKVNGDNGYKNETNKKIAITNNQVISPT